jgi:hypothetical protein
MLRVDVCVHFATRRLKLVYELIKVVGCMARKKNASDWPGNEKPEMEKTH